MDSPRPAKRQKRRSVACERCHSQKIKCSGDRPCQGCLIAKRPEGCSYPFRDRNVTVPESYLEKLESEIEELKARAAINSPQYRSNDPPLIAPQAQVAFAHPVDSDVPNPLLEVSDGDGLFSGQESAQPVYNGHASDTAFGDRLLHCINNKAHNSISCTIPGHVAHPSFNRLLNKDFQLPNRNQANLLIRRVDSFIGTNYHLFEKRSFFRKLDRAYSGEGPPDLLFTCHLFAILALGELYSNCKTTPGDSRERVPGTLWFVQAVGLLQDLYEIASIEQVQILLLLSFYANSLGRVKSAHVYCGIALRLAVSLGLHRSQSGTSTMDPVHRETRRRVWWTLYLFDRMISSKLGYPLGIQDEDIDVEMPSMDGLSAAEQSEFSDPIHLRAHASLARITGDILSDIYCLPQHKRATFVQRVHRVLNDLRNWDAQLPAALRLHDCSARNLYTLHLQYHLCVLQTTRPILFHIFKARFHMGADTDQQQQAFSPTTLALADACVQAARTMNQLLSKLFVEGALAVFGYFDSHYLFSSTLILIISAVMEPATHVSDAVQTAFSLLRAMSTNGNISAKDYLVRLETIRSGVSTVRAEAEGKIQPPIQTHAAAGQPLQPHLSETENLGETTGFLTPSSSHYAGPMISGDDLGNEDPLGNPFIETFLAEKAFQWEGGPSPEQDMLRQFAHELGDEFVFGT